MPDNYTPFERKTQAPPRVGQTDPRYPAVDPSPIAYSRVSVRELRDVPVQSLSPASPRLAVLDFRRTAAPGMSKEQRPRTYGHGAARLAGYVLSLCVVRDAGEWFFETSAAPWDEWLGRHEALKLSPEVLADVYRAVQQKLIADEARQAQRGTGRN